MKKSYLIIAVTALLLAGCAGNDTFRKDINGNDTSNGAISFNAITEKATKAENSDAYYTQKFFTHQESFQVWARKSNQPTQEIFDGTKVKVEEGTTANTYTYTYAPERFWDKLAGKYHFYAAAPARPESDTEWIWNFHGEGITSDATLSAGYFSIDKDFTLNEVNLKHIKNGGADNKLESVFKEAQVSATDDSKDIDLLIAAPTEVTNSYYNVANPNAVNLNFIHILSKLNVTIKTTLGTVRPTDGAADGSDDHTYQVKLLAFEVKNVPNVGTFKEDPNIIPANNKKQIRWTLSTPTAPATNKTSILTGIEGLDNENKIKTDALSVPYNPTEAQKLYIVESLIIPQGIKYERVALDGLSHDAVDVNDPIPYTSYEAYEIAKHNDVDRLSEAQFNALINNGAFVEWSYYQANAIVPGETKTTIDQATFNDRVVEATKEGTTPYSNYSEYTQAKGNNATLTEAKFNALIKDGAFVDWTNYQANAIVPGETETTINEDEFNKRIAYATATPETYILAYDEPKEPYFTIKYSIDGEIFEANYNLAAAFMNYNNNSQKWDNTNKKYVDLETNDPTKFDFHEGWQNTLNIVINPTAIEFTADVAEWSDNKNVDFEIENGNE